MKRLYILILFLALVLTAGCKKYLEQAPDQRTQVNTVEKVGELLTSAYAEANYIPFTESASDNAEDKGPGVGTEPREVVLPFYFSDNEDSENDTPTFYWNSSYEAIAAANIALEAVKKAGNATDYLPYKGEALVARAYAHFMLVTLFAKAYEAGGLNDSPGVPYVTEPETKVSAHYERGTVESVYEQIEKDLLEGLPLIKNSAYSVPKYHFNVAAANAFAARFFLFKKDYQKVVTYASAVSPGNNFASVIRPWNTRYRTYTDSEMQTNFTAATEASSLLLIETASSWARTVTPRYGFGQKLNNDLFGRANVTGAIWAHKLLYYGVPNYTFLKWKEYFVLTSPNATIGYPYTIVPVLTTDEALMNRAEAYAQLGQTDMALKDLNTFASTRINSYSAVSHAITLDKIKVFYLYPANTDVKIMLTKTILDFKKAEFMQEGMRWFDILRHRLTVKHDVLNIRGNVASTIELGPDDPRRLFQLPSQVELSGVERNPR